MCFCAMEITAYKSATLKSHYKLKQRRVSNICEILHIPRFSLLGQNKVCAKFNRYFAFFVPNLFDET